MPNRQERQQIESQRIYKMVNETMKFLNDKVPFESDREKILKGVQAKLQPVDSTCFEKAVSSGELIEKYDESSKHPFEFEGISTGIKSLDDTLLGIQRKNFVVVGARTGVGKTMIANYFVASAASQGEKILYLALEENEDEVGDRWAKIVRSNEFDVPEENVSFLYSEAVEPIIHDREAIHGLMLLASQFGYTMICVDMLNNLIETVDSEEANDFLTSMVHWAQDCNMTLLMTIRLRQPKDKQEAAFPTIDSIYGRVTLGYLVNKFIAVTDVPEFKQDGKTALRLHVLKNRRKRIGAETIYPLLYVDNMLKIEDRGHDDTAAEQYEQLQEQRGGYGYGPAKKPKGDAEGAGF